jgi:tetratricopeptide (TPR) repeat protein
MTSRRILPILALVVRIAAGQNQPPSEILQHAIALHQSGDIEGAIREYRAFLKLRPDAVQVRSNLGAALSKAGRYQEAIAEYKLALEKDSRNPAILLNLALAHYKIAQIPTAAAELATIHELQPANRQALFLLADCQLRLGENKKVIDLLSPLEKESPDDKVLIYLLGTALIRDKQPERGQVLVDRILRDGDSAEARLLLGTTKFYAHDYAGALADMKKAVDLNPQLPDLFAYYGLALLSTGDEAGAADAFGKELASNPNDFVSNLQLGVLMKQDQNYDGAHVYFDRALMVRPGDQGVRYQLATLDIAGSRLDEARRTLEQLIKEAPQFTEAHVSLATVYYRLKRKADGDKERAIVLNLNAEKQAKQPGVNVK